MSDLPSSSCDAPPRSPRPPLRPRLRRPPRRRTAMSAESVAGLVLSALALAYLLYALC